MEADPSEQAILRAHQLNAVGRPADAIEILTSTPGTADHPSALMVLSDSYCDLERFDEALAATDGLLRQDPQDVYALLRRSFVLMSLKRQNEALAPVLAALQLAPDETAVQATAANVYRTIHHLPAAMEHANRAVALDPGSELGWDAVARVQMAQGDAAGTMATSQRLLSINPESVEAKKMLGAAQAVSGGSLEAQSFETLSSVLRSDPSEKNVRQLLIDLARPRRLGLPTPVLAIAFLAGGGGLIALAWAVMVVQRWMSLPKDIRTLVWSDRSARIQIVLALLASVVLIVGFAILMVYTWLNLDNTTN